MNKLLIKIALYILRLVNEDKIEYKNSWRYYINRIDDFLYDERHKSV